MANPPAVSLSARWELELRERACEPELPITRLEANQGRLHSI